MIMNCDVKGDSDDEISIFGFDLYRLRGTNRSCYHHRITTSSSPYCHIIIISHRITWTDGEANTEKTMVVNKLTPAVMKKSQRHSDKLLSS